MTDDDEVALVERIVETYGGSIRPSVTKRTKYVIATPNAYSTNQVEWEKAVSQDTPIMSTEWLAECMRQKTLVDPDADWEVEKPEEPAAAAAVSSSSSSTGLVGTKRKAADDDDDVAAAPPPPKKAKTASSVAVATATPAVPATKPVASSSAPVRPPHPALKPKTCWMGVCSYDGTGDKYPFTWNLDAISGSQVSGTIDWPTLNNAKTKFKGTVSANSLAFQEYEVIQGEDDVAVPADYAGTLDLTSTDTISGTVNAGSPDGGKFTVTLVEKDDDDDNGDAMETDTGDKLIGGALKQKHKYSGVVIQQHPFDLAIESRSGNKVEGTINWKNLKCSTKFRGTIDPDTEELSIEEYAIAKIEAGGVEPELPMRYKANMSADLSSLEGSWGTDLANPEGSFKISI